MKGNGFDFQKPSRQLTEYELKVDILDDSKKEK